MRAMTASVVLLFAAFPDALLGRLAFYSETLLPSSPTSELSYRTQGYPLKNFLYAFDYPNWPYGYGIGTASLGLQYIARILHLPPVGIGVENGFGGIVLELGIVGFIVFIILISAIVIYSWNVVRKLKGSPLFPVGFVLFWFAFLLLFPITYSSLTMHQDFVMSSFLWLSLGILFRLPQISLPSAADTVDDGAHRLPGVG
jgi:hypothetical protein